jgi:DNA-binding transcriptional ArsR family regulator
MVGERGVASPKEIGEALDVDLQEVSYHVRNLKARALIRLVRTEQRRGVKEHFYELSEPLVYLDDEEWRCLPRQIQARFSVSLLRIAMTDAVEALRAGTFDTANCHHSRTTMPVDAQGQREVIDVLNAALERLIEIRDNCAERMTLPSNCSIPIAIYISAFETAAGAQRRERGS